MAEIPRERWPLPPNDLQRRGAVLLYNAAGAGRLKSLKGPLSIADPMGLTPNSREEFLALDGVPLVRRQTSECPTCERLLQVGFGTSSLARHFADGINRLRLAECTWDTEAWLDCLAPMFQLFPRGWYLVSLEAMLPTDGEGQFFWDAFPTLRAFHALSSRPWATLRPTFLAPTQSPACFRESSFRLAQAEYAQKPGIAFHLSCKGAALLDGHHRALAAAVANVPFDCIVISPLRDIDEQLGRMHERIPNPLYQQLGIERWEFVRNYYSEIDQKLTDELVDRVTAMPQTRLPRHVAPRNISQAYPHLEMIFLVEHLTKGNDTLPDRVIERVLRREIDLPELRDLYLWPEKLIGSIMGYLRGTRDARTMPVALRVVRDPELLVCRASALEVLASMPCDEVDEFFVEFLCSYPEPPRPELKQIADDYFRKRAEAQRRDA